MLKERNWSRAPSSMDSWHRFIVYFLLRVIYLLSSVEFVGEGAETIRVLGILADSSQ